MVVLRMAQFTGGPYFSQIALTVSSVRGPANSAAISLSLAMARAPGSGSGGCVSVSLPGAVRGTAAGGQGMGKRVLALARGRKWGRAWKSVGWPGPGEERQSME